MMFGVLPSAVWALFIEDVDMYVLTSKEVMIHCFLFIFAIGYSLGFVFLVGFMFSLPFLGSLHSTISSFIFI